MSTYKPQDGRSDISGSSGGPGAEERFRLLVDSVKDYAIYMLDPQGHITSWNGGAQRIKGYSAEEIIGRHFSVFYPPEAQDKPEHELEVARNADRFEEEGWRVRKDGSRFWAHVVLTAIRDAKGELLGFAKVTRDITERRQAEENITALNRTLEDRNSALEALNRELEAFSYSVSHDLRAPLRAIDGFSQALLEDHAGALDPQGRHLLQRVRAASQRMALLIDDLLQLSRITRAEFRREPVDMSAVTREIAATLAKSRPDRNVSLHVEDGIHAKGDPQLLRIVLENLLDNAWKFTSRNGNAAIHVGMTEPVNGKAVYYVKDNGAGFDMVYAGKLFKAFQRLHKEAEFPGTGIGLATVQRIIHRHGGRIWAEAESGKGAAFYFELPAHDPA